MKKKSKERIEEEKNKSKKYGEKIEKKGKTKKIRKE